MIESKLNSGQQPNSRLPKRSHIPMKHKATDSLPNSSAHMAATQVINVFFFTKFASSFVLLCCT